MSEEISTIKHTPTSQQHNHRFVNREQQVRRQKELADKSRHRDVIQALRHVITSSSGGRKTASDVIQTVKERIPEELGDCVAASSNMTSSSSDSHGRSLENSPACDATVSCIDQTSVKPEVLNASDKVGAEDAVKDAVMEQRMSTEPHDGEVAISQSRKRLAAESCRQRTCNLMTVPLTKRCMAPPSLRQFYENGGRDYNEYLRLIGQNKSMKPEAFKPEAFKPEVGATHVTTQVMSSRLLAGSQCTLVTSDERAPEAIDRQYSVSLPGFTSAICKSTPVGGEGGGGSKLSAPSEHQLATSEAPLASLHRSVDGVFTTATTSPKSILAQALMTAVTSESISIGSTKVPSGSFLESFAKTIRSPPSASAFRQRTAADVRRPAAAAANRLANEKSAAAAADGERCRPSHVVAALSSVNVASGPTAGDTVSSNYQSRKEVCSRSPVEQSADAVKWLLKGPAKEAETQYSTPLASSTSSTELCRQTRPVLGAGSESKSYGRNYWEQRPMTQSYQRMPDVIEEPPRGCVGGGNWYIDSGVPVDASVLHYSQMNLTPMESSALETNPGVTGVLQRLSSPYMDVMRSTSPEVGGAMDLSRDGAVEGRHQHMVTSQLEPIPLRHAAQLPQLYDDLDPDLPLGYDHARGLGDRPQRGDLNYEFGSGPQLLNRPPISTRSDAAITSSMPNDVFLRSSAGDVSGRALDVLDVDNRQVDDNDNCMESRSWVDDIASWSTEDVARFLTTIPGCAEYVEIFVREKIDGISLLHVTEDHLLNVCKMRLGPIIRLRLALDTILRASWVRPAANAASDRHVGITTDVVAHY